MLHLPTLSVVTAVVMAFSGLLILLLARQRDTLFAMSYWGAAMLSGAAGLVLMAAGGAPAPGGLVGEVLVLLATALSWTGARAFIGVRPRPGVVLAGPAAWAVWALLPTGADVAMLTVMAQVIGVTYTAAAAAELWRGREERLRSRNMGVALLVLHAVVHGLRAASIAVFGMEAGGAVVGMVLMFETLLYTLGMAFVLLAVMKERAELRTTQQLRLLAFVDGLTGLGNRRQFDVALEREHGRALRGRTPLALLLLDVDHFKSFNDTYGHQAGDDCLRAIAFAVQAAVHRPGDVAVRYGGEEFAVLLPRTDEAGAAAVAEGIHAGVAALRLAHAGNPHGRVSVSIGAALVRPMAGTPPGALVRAADQALYRAKDGGRNQTVLAARDGSAAAPSTPVRLAAAGQG